MNTQDSSVDVFDSLKPVDGFECIHLDVTDELLNTAKIVAYMYD